MNTTYEDSGWVEELIAVLAKAVPPIAPECPVARRGQLVVSRATNRRASVRWASETRVCIVYDDDHADRTFDNGAFLRLYAPV